jgi:ferredoxin
LRERGYEVIGPCVRDGAIVYDRVEELSEFPAGWTDEQGGGEYRLRKRDDDALFQYASTPQSWKRLLHPPSQTLLKIEKNGHELKFVPVSEAPRRLAFVGVRPCDLRAIEILDRVLAGDQYPDSGYEARRRSTFLVVAQCGHPAATCFCASLKTGPWARGGFDVALTEILEGEHRFLVEAGTDLGQAIVEQLASRPVEESDLEAAERVRADAVSKMTRSLKTEGLKHLLYASTEHPQWEAVAKQCLACTNCTMVCPTCFCTTIEDSSSLDGQNAQRARLWDSCFSQSFSYIHGGSVRSSVASRYRQWLMHKLASWQDQFGSLGCVGCGRCITWCPVGIDITQVTREIQRQPLARGV